MKKKGSFFDHKYLTRILIYVVTSLIAILIIFYLGYHFSTSLRSDTTYEYVSLQSYPDKAESRCYIFRYDAPVKKTSSGYVSALVSNSERVRVSDTIAYVYSGGSSQGVTDQIKYLNQLILYFENADTSSKDSTKIKTDIKSTIIDMKEQARNGNAESFSSLRNDLFIDIDSMALLTGKITHADLIASLKSRLDSLNSGLGSQTGTITSPASGNYFSDTDGMEAIFNSDDIDSLTYSIMEEKINQASVVTHNADDYAGRIMKSYKWYLVTLVPASVSAKMTEGDSYSVILENNCNYELPVSLYRIIKGSTDAYLVLECSRIPDNFDFTRSQKLTINIEDRYVFRVPQTALRVYDGYTGVFVLNKWRVEFRRVDVLETDGSYYICSSSDPLVKPEEPEETGEAVPEETAAETDQEDTLPYPYLSENELVITSGKGLDVGMTYDPKN